MFFNNTSILFPYLKNVLFVILTKEKYKKINKNKFKFVNLIKDRMLKNLLTKILCRFYYICYFSPCNCVSGNNKMTEPGGPRDPGEFFFSSRAKGSTGG